MPRLPMITVRQLLVLSNLIVSALLISSCAIKDLHDDLDVVEQEYGYFKGQASVVDDSSNILVGVFKRDENGLSRVNYRAVTSSEPFYILLTKADYVIFAFSDTNGDFAYQAGEPAAQIDGPFINWFSDMHGQDEVDYAALQIEEIKLAKATVLEQKLDFSLGALRKVEKVSENFLETVSWDDERFSDENVRLGMWEPGSFLEEVGYGLYVLKEYDPTLKSILLVHSVNDSPRVFESLANTIPADYQLLLFHYPSAASLEYTSYILSEALDEVVLRGQIPQLDIIAHSMGGLVSKGMIHLADEAVRQKMRLFISIASPFGGHAAAAAGIKWSPAVAPSWRAMAPDSQYLQTISGLDLSQGPSHHLIYSFSHEAGGKNEGDDGVVTVGSQLTVSAQRNATAIYGIADNHVGAVSNPCTLALLTAILQDGSTRATAPECEAADASPVSPTTASD